MAEQFLSRLTEIESSIASLGETLKRMVTLLSALNEIKSEVRIATEQIMTAIQTIPQAQAQAGIQEKTIAAIRGDLANLSTSVNSTLDSFRQEIQTMVQNISAPAPTIAPAPTPPPAPAPKPAPIPAPAPAPVQVAPAQVVAPVATGGSVSPHAGMQIAAQLEAMIATLKMGCKSGAVLDQIASSKAEITKIVPSDPIMVKIDKWNGIVAAVPRRKELQARDILKIKKEIKKEIKRYQPA
ncbi:MAG: hypothetical protein V3T87_01245 [Candidatus Thorarchaeota archaeon]